MLSICKLIALYQYKRITRLTKYIFYKQYLRKHGSLVIRKLFLPDLHRHFLCIFDLCEENATSNAAATSAVVVVVLVIVIFTAALFAVAVDVAAVVIVVPIRIPSL